MRIAGLDYKSCPRPVMQCRLKAAGPTLHPPKCLPGFPARGWTLPYRLPWRSTVGPRALGHLVQSWGDQHKQQQVVLFPLTSTSNSSKSSLLGCRKRASVSPGSVHATSRAVASREAETLGGSLVRVPLPSQGPQGAYQGAPGTVGRDQDSSILGVCLRDWQQEAETRLLSGPLVPPAPHR